MPHSTTLPRLLLSSSLKTEIQQRYATLTEEGQQRLDHVLQKALEHQEKLLQKHSEQNPEFSQQFEEFLKNILMTEAEKQEEKCQSGIEGIFDSHDSNDAKESRDP